MSNIPNEPGVYEGIDRGVYEAIDAANQSRLKIISDKSPLHCWASMVQPKAPTAALDFGQAWHKAVLEPQAFDAEYAGMAEKVDRRTNVGKATWGAFVAANPGKQILEPGEYPLILAMREAIWRRPDCQRLLADAMVECCIIWEDADTGVRCKALIDAIKLEGYKSWTTVTDLKSARDASFAGFRGAIAEYAYHYQMAFYLDGLNTLFPAPRLGVLLAQEKTFPYAAKPHSVHEDDLDFGRKQYKRDLAIYARCIERDEWPGYANGIDDCPMKPWRRMDYELAEKLRELREDD